MSVRVEKQGAITTVVLSRPQARNAVDPATAKALADAFRAFDADSEASVAVLFGEGGTFCAGADLKAFAEGAYDRVPAEGDGPMGPSRLLLDKPVVAAINGTAAGAGLSLALACDLRVIASDAQLIVVFVRVGLVPDAGSLFFLTRMLGYGKAMELALTGNPVSAAEAHRLGLVSAVAAPGELLSTVTELASGLSAGPAEAYALIKRGMERALSLDLEQALELEAHLQSLAGRTADHQEAVRAFLDKRKPVFRGAE